MDISSFRRSRPEHAYDARAKKLFCLFLFVASFFIHSTSHAFNGLSHEQITRMAFRYMKANPKTATTTKSWTTGMGDDETLMQDLLIRTTVDADYLVDTFLDAWFHTPVAGAKLDNNRFTLFSAMSHYLNITIPGKYWQNDGYGYLNSSREGTDGYLATLSAKVRGDLSSALGGSHHDHQPHGIPMGKFRYGFKGTDKDWKRMYFDGIDATEVVFPPANAPAQMAFDAMLGSERSTKTWTETWNEHIPVVTGTIKDDVHTRHYWRGEIKNLPQGFDLLGITMHMAQDMLLPHHALGLGDVCHQALESLSDSLSCNSKKKFSDKIYITGAFGVDRKCDKLYDPKLVEKYLEEIPALDRAKKTNIYERVRSLAYVSGRWMWGLPTDSSDNYGTQLPDGSVYTANTCDELMKVQAVQKQLKLHYNMAIAATVALFEISAREYEEKNAKPLPMPLSDFRRFFLPDIFNFFWR